MRQLFVFIFTLLFMGPALAAGPDEGLYDPLPPKGSAFVRFVNTAPEQRGMYARGVRYADAPPLSITPYYAMAQGTAKFSSGSVEIEHTLKEGVFYTLIAGEYPRVVEDAPNDQPLKAQIVLYNIGNPKAVSLKTADGKTEVIGRVMEGYGKARFINPVKARFSIFGEKEKIADMPEIVLQRRASYTAFWARGMAAPIWVRATTEVPK